MSQAQAALNNFIHTNADIVNYKQKQYLSFPIAANGFLSRLTLGNTQPSYATSKIPTLSRQTLNDMRQAGQQVLNQVKTTIHQQAKGNLWDISIDKAFSAIGKLRPQDQNLLYIALCNYTSTDLLGFPLFNASATGHASFQSYLNQVPQNYKKDVIDFHAPVESRNQASLKSFLDSKFKLCHDSEKVLTHFIKHLNIQLNAWVVKGISTGLGEQYYRTGVNPIALLTSLLNKEKILYNGFLSTTLKPEVANLFSTGRGLTLESICHQPNMINLHIDFSKSNQQACDFLMHFLSNQTDDWAPVITLMLNTQKIPKLPVDIDAFDFDAQNLNGYDDVPNRLSHQLPQIFNALQINADQDFKLPENEQELLLGKTIIKPQHLFAINNMSQFIVIGECDTF